MTADKKTYQDSNFDWGKCDSCAKNTPESGSPNLKDRLMSAFTGKLSRSSSQTSVNSDVYQRDFVEEAWSTDKGLNNNDLSIYKEKPTAAYGTFDPDCIDRTVCDELAFLLHSCLLKAQQQEVHRRIMLPQDLIQRLANEIMVLSRSEPYGLRGCVLFINLQSEEKGSERLGRIECNSHVVSTFEVHVTLKEDVKRWCTFKDLVFRGVFSCKEEELYLSSDFKLNKKKLYRNSANAYTQCC